jgi:hypothetical protein
VRALSTLHARRWHGRIEVAVMTLAWSISVTVDALDAGGACALMKRGGAGVLPLLSVAVMTWRCAPLPVVRAAANVRRVMPRAGADRPTVAALRKMVGKVLLRAPQSAGTARPRHFQFVISA